MSFLTTPSKVLLALILISVVLWLLVELRQFQRRKNQRRLLVQKAHGVWLTRAVFFSEWRARDGNRFYNFEHPYYQWHLQQESSAFDRFLRLKKNESRSERNYLKNLQSRIRDNVSIEEPPDK